MSDTDISVTDIRCQGFFELLGRALLLSRLFVAELAGVIRCSGRLTGNPQANFSNADDASSENRIVRAPELIAISRQRFFSLLMAIDAV